MLADEKWQLCISFTSSDSWQMDTTHTQRKKNQDDSPTLLSVHGGHTWLSAAQNNKPFSIHSRASLFLMSSFPLPPKTHVVKLCFVVFCLALSYSKKGDGEETFSLLVFCSCLLEKVEFSVANMAVVVYCFKMSQFPPIVFVISHEVVIFFYWTLAHLFKALLVG